jgi:hypothetical protein
MDGLYPCCPVVVCHAQQMHMNSAKIEQRLYLQVQDKHTIQQGIAGSMYETLVSRPDEIASSQQHAG